MNPVNAARFSPAEDGVDPNLVPLRVLTTGAAMPAIGLGTFGSDHVGGEEIAVAVRGALEVGYRHIDCAAVYGNERLIGEVLAQAIAKAACRARISGSRRSCGMTCTMRLNVVPAFRKTLADLRLDYLDLYLIHWPFPNHHPPHADVGSRAPNAQPYIHESYMKVWRQLERLVDMGLVRHIGDFQHDRP